MKKKTDFTTDSFEVLLYFIIVFFVVILWAYYTN